MTADDIRTTVEAYIAEALELRVAVEVPAPGSDPKRVLESLLSTRQRLDRVEELLHRALRIRHRVQRSLTIVRAQHDDARDTALTNAKQQRGGPVTRDNDQYTSAQERNAEANLATLELRRTLRQAEEVASYCDEAVDLLRLAHRGLEGVRVDHMTIVRSTQFESTLDR